MAQFRVEGSNETVLLRRVHGATRKLHPAELCYRSFGWTCEPARAMRDAQGHLWSAFSARDKSGHMQQVRQAVFAYAGARGDLADITDGAASWADTASWFWAAAMPGSAVSESIAITVSTPGG